MSTQDPQEFPYAVTVVRPGHPTVHLGYRYQHAAEQAARTLTGMLRNTTHPEGTTITSAPTPAGVELTPPLAASPQAIAEHPEFDVEQPGVFPDLYARLCAQEGSDEGRTIWLQACSYFDWLHESGPDDEPDDTRALIDPEVLEAVLLEHVGQDETRKILADLVTAAGTR